MEKAKARLRQITNPTLSTSRRSPANKSIRTSSPTNKNCVSTNCSTVLSQPIDDQLYYMRARNHVSKGLNINEPSVIDHICRTIENIPLASLNLQPSLDSTRSANKYFCHERRQLQELSRWLNYKMQSLKSHEQFDFSIFVDYRQYVLNMALGKLLDIFRKHSTEAAELMSELWTKTFGFMQFLLELFSNNNSQKQRQIALLQKSQEELHIGYIERLNQRQQEFFTQHQALKKQFKNSILSNRDLKRKCTHINRSYWEERHRRKQIQDGLIKSLNINMQLASGQNLEWSHKVFKTMLNTYRSFDQNACKVKGTKFKQFDDYETEEVLKRYLSDIKRSQANQVQAEQSDFENFIPQIKSDNKKDAWDDLTIKQIMEMVAPKNIHTSTDDLYLLKEMSIQTVSEQVDQACNTNNNSMKEVSTQSRIILKQQSTQTGKENIVTVPQRQLLKRRASIFKAKPILAHVNTNETLSNFSKDLSAQKKNEQKKNEQRKIEQKKNEQNDLKQSKQTEKKKNAHNYVPIIKSSYGVKATAEQNKQQKKVVLTDASFDDEIMPGMKFSQIYSHHKRKLLENTEKFKKGIIRRRSFYRAKQQAWRVKAFREISHISTVHNFSQYKQNTWTQDHYAQEQVWSNAFKEVKQKIVSPVNVTMATASLFRMFSLTIQSLARKHKHISMRQRMQSKSKIVTKINTGQMEALKFIIMRRLNYDLRFQFSDKELKHIMNNLLFLKRSKQLEMFSLLMGLTEGYQEVGANELELYVRTFSMLDVSEKFNVERDTRTTSYLLNEKFGEICDGYFEPEEREKLMQKLTYNEGSSISIDEVAKTFVRRYTEKKRLSFDSYEYIYECTNYFGSADLYSIIKHLKISIRAKAVMMKEFSRFMDCSSKKDKYITYQRFWTFCEKVKFPNRSAILEYCRRQAAKAKDVREYCQDDIGKVVDLMAIHNVKIPPIIIKIVSLLTRLGGLNQSKMQFWTHFLICFCHYQIVEHKIMRLLPSEFKNLETAYLHTETAA